MDTSFLTRDAYQVLIGRSGEISDILRTEIGAMARHFQGEDNYLKGVHQEIFEIIADPEDWLDFWNLLDDNDPDAFRTALTAFADEIQQVLQKPIDQRGPIEW